MPNENALTTLGRAIAASAHPYDHTQTIMWPNKRPRVPCDAGAIATTLWDDVRIKDHERGHTYYVADDDRLRERLGLDRETYEGLMLKPRDAKGLPIALQDVTRDMVLMALKRIINDGKVWFDRPAKHSQAA